jgi:hypothetical protein
MQFSALFACLFNRSFPKKSTPDTVEQVRSTAVGKIGVGAVGVTIGAGVNAALV